MARRGGQGQGQGGGGGGGLSTPALFDPDFKQAFVDWLVREQGKTGKSAQEYYYQLSDVTRTIHERAGLPVPDPPMAQLRVQEFVLEHADAYTAIVVERKRAGKKISFLEHLKRFLGLKSLVLPPRKDPKSVNPDFKQDFLGWLARERDVDGTKTAMQHYYSTLELTKCLHRRLHGQEGEQGAEEQQNASAASSVGGEEGAAEEEEVTEDGGGGNKGEKSKAGGENACLASIDKAALRALVKACDAQGTLPEVLRPFLQRKRQAAFLNHLTAYLDLPCLALPPPPPPPRPPVDPGPLHPALKQAFGEWVQRERCVSDRTAQQYTREVGRVVKRALEEDEGLRAAEAAGTLKCLLRPSGEGEEEAGTGAAGFEKEAAAAAAGAHLPAFARAEEGLQKRMRGWGTFKEFLGLAVAAPSPSPSSVGAAASVAGEGEENEEEGAAAAGDVVVGMEVVVEEEVAAAAASMGEGDGVPAVAIGAETPPASMLAETPPTSMLPSPSSVATAAAKSAGTGAGKARKRPRVKAEDGAGGGGAQQGQRKRKCIPIFLTPGLQEEYLAWLDGEVKGGEESRRDHLDAALKMAWKIYRAVHPTAPAPTSSAAVGGGGGQQGEEGRAEQQQQQQQQKGLDRAGVQALLLGHDAAVRRVERSYPSIRAPFAVFYRFVTGAERAPEPEGAEADADAAAEVAGAGALHSEEEEGEGGFEEEEEEEESMAGVELSPDGDGGAADAADEAAARSLNALGEEVYTLPLDLPPPAPGLPGGRAGGKRQSSSSAASAASAGAGKPRPRRRTPGERMAAMEQEMAGLRRENDRLADQLLVLRRQKEEAARVAAQREAELFRRIEELGGDTRGLSLPSVTVGGGGGGGFRGVSSLCAAAGLGPRAAVGGASEPGVVGAAAVPSVPLVAEANVGVQQQLEQQQLPPPPPLPPTVVPLPEPKETGGMAEIHV